MNKYLILKGKYGLGNRLQALCEAIVYCQLTGRRLIIDWRDARYSDLQANAFPLLFESSQFETSLPDPDMGPVAPAIWRGKLDKELEWMKRHFAPSATATATARERERATTETFSMNVSKLDYDEQVVVMFDHRFHWNYFAKHLHRLPSDWPTNSPRDLLHYLFKKFIIPCHEIRTAVEEFNAEHFTTPMIGLHVRFTDNLRGASKSLDSLAIYFNAADKLLHKHQNARLFLATDNQCVEERFSKKYPSLVAMPKQYPEKKHQAIHDPSSGINRTAVAREAMSEMYLLSECSHMIYSSKSTYAQLAAVISNMPVDNLVDCQS